MTESVQPVTPQTWKLVLAYDGTNFHGWQVQPGLPTIQGALASAILHVTGETVLPQGSGRTDAGVHALAQVTSFVLHVPIPAQNFHKALNRVLPASIRVLSVEVVPDDFHARHKTVRKTYEYRVFPRQLRAITEQETICPPFLAPYVWNCRWPLQLDLLCQTASDVVGEHDFTSFAASDPDLSERESDGPPASNVRTIFSSSWSLQDQILYYRVCGSGFLHHMVRNLVGTFIEIGAGRMLPSQMPQILQQRDRNAAGPTAPPRGLFLLSVEYA